MNRVENALVTKVYGRYYYALDEDTHTHYCCTLRGKLKKAYYPLRNIVVVGDRVVLGSLHKSENLGWEASIEDILPRKNCLSRQAIGIKDHETYHINRTIKSLRTRRKIINDPREQIITANIDQILIISSFVQPTLKTGFIDRVLCSAKLEQVTPIIIFNKTDLIDRSSYATEIQLYKELGYSVLPTSAATHENIDALHVLIHDKISVLCGHSGVGKSSLINKLLGEERQMTQEVSEYHQKGVHTTTNAEMISLPQSGFIIDTPGIREFGLHGIEPETLDTLFDEMYDRIGLCKFGNKCTHSHEPGCAILQAVEDGLISETRYQSYLRILESL